MACCLHSPFKIGLWSIYHLIGLS